MGKTVKSFADYDFNDGDVPEKYWGDYPNANYFKGEFLPTVRRELKKMATNIGAELVSFNKMHFECSAFFKRNDSYVYVSIGDCRFNNWYGNVLYRSAENEKDYSGGSNCYCSYENLEHSLDRALN